MTDKEIIIDDVDVSGCENLIQGIVPFGCMEDRKTCSCMNNPNYLYKQLKRKEQECKELKEDRERWKSNFNGKVSAIEELLQQLDQLKAKNIKIYKTLTEIKPILEFYANSNMGEEQPDKTYHIMLNGSYIMVYDPKPARQALQKISEVENEN